MFRIERVALSEILPLAMRYIVSDDVICNLRLRDIKQNSNGVLLCCFANKIVKLFELILDILEKIYYYNGKICTNIPKI